MSLPRKHNLEQLKKLRRITKGKDIGDVVKKDEHKKESDMPNSYWIDNPVDRKIDTYESFIKSDNKQKIDEYYSQYDARIFALVDNYISDNKDLLEEFDIEEIVDGVIEYNSDKFAEEELYSMRDDIRDLVSQYKGESEGEFAMSESVINRGVGPGNNDFFINNKKQVNTSLNGTYLKVGKNVNIGKKNLIIDAIDNNNVYLYDGIDIVKYSLGEFFKKLDDMNESIHVLPDSGFPSEFWTSLNENNDVDIDIEVESDAGKGVPIPRRRIKKSPPVRRIGPSVKPKRRPSPEFVPELPGQERPDWTLTKYGKAKLSENTYIDDIKMVVCDSCGAKVINDDKHKIAHIRGKHFKHPEMDGGFPYMNHTNRPGEWPQGGKSDNDLMKLYFPNSYIPR